MCAFSLAGIRCSTSLLFKVWCGNQSDANRGSSSITNPILFNKQLWNQIQSRQKMCRAHKATQWSEPAGGEGENTSYFLMELPIHSRCFWFSLRSEAWWQMMEVSPVLLNSHSHRKHQTNWGHQPNPPVVFSEYCSWSVMDKNNRKRFFKTTESNQIYASTVSLQNGKDDLEEWKHLHLAKTRKKWERARILRWASTASWCVYWF